MAKKIKVVWICHFSNPQIREKLRFDRLTPTAILKSFLGKGVVSDFAAWNSNAIKEFEKFENVELHIIAPHSNISGLQEFKLNQVFYHIFASESDTVWALFNRYVLKRVKKSFSKNSQLICHLVDKIQPDIIHLIGAENPYYGESVLYIPQNIPLIVSLQTLMNDPAFFSNYTISREEYDYRARLEKQIIRRVNYVGTKGVLFRRIILELVSTDVNFLSISLAVGEEISINHYDKKYDFVYFAANISKAVDYAIEAFAIAKQFHPEITLHIVGGYNDSLMQQLHARMLKLGLGNEVSFTGLLATHNDVINEIRKARFALLPLKIDLVSGTIREAMANGLPVVTTITPATPKLNEKRLSVLLSEKGDFQTMAANMCVLLENEELVKKIQENAMISLNERYNNTVSMEEWVRAYESIV